MAQASSEEKTDKKSQSDMNQLKYIFLRYEVRGRVQGVFFRWCTQNRAAKHPDVGNNQIVGWVQNTKRGTVIGEAYAQSNRIDKLYVYFHAIFHDNNSVLFMYK